MTTPSECGIIWADSTKLRAFFFPVCKVANVCRCLYILFTKAAVTRWNLCATTLRKKLSASSLPCNIKSIHFFQNVETGLEVLFFPALLLCTITMNCVQLVASFPDLLIEQGNKTNFMKYHLRNHHAHYRGWKQYLSGEVQKSFMKLTILHSATPARTCFAEPLEKFQLKF